MDEIELLDGQQQSGNEYFGNPEVFGLLAAHLRAAIVFLQAQGKVDSVPKAAHFTSSVTIEEIAGAFPRQP